MLPEEEEEPPPELRREERFNIPRSSIRRRRPGERDVAAHLISWPRASIDPTSSMISTPDISPDCAH
jgi:hypothetical protein